nr:hypothetical protein B0A51_01543 [Rachicladosporium sp. CCFEE 5018]
MSLKQEIETWVAALAAYDNNEFDSALRCFETIADTSKILFNSGVIYATLGEHAKAVALYQRAVQLDQYLAVAYFQTGVSNFLMGDFEEALANFNDTLLYLRGNRDIDYEQLGLKFKLHACEVLFNRGLCYIYLQQKDAGLQDLIFAAREKAVPDHDVIDEAIKEQADGYTVFSIPVGVVYRPNEAKVKNLKKQDYLGKARLVAAFEQQQRHNDPRRQAALAASGIDDRPGEKLSYAALNLVRPNLTSRSRQQSEPPMHRNVFPPTPPPELERSDSAYGKRKSSESLRSQSSSIQNFRPSAKPLRLELGAAAFEQKSQTERSQPERSQTDRPRLAPKRAESERPQMRREYSHPSARPSAEPRRRDPEQRRSHHSSRQPQTPEIHIIEDPIEAYSAAATPPRSHHRTKSNAHSLRQTQHSIVEEPEAESEASYSSSSEPPLAFEIVSPQHRSHSRRPSHTRRPSAPELRKLRLKVHGVDDTRYVMTSASPVFVDLLEQIRVKFGFGPAGVKLKIRDEEGDYVTLGDQDDLDLAVLGVKEGLKGLEDQGGMGKLDVWVVGI